MLYDRRETTDHEGPFRESRDFTQALALPDLLFFCALYPSSVVRMEVAPC
jgi:hypothetical protein